MKNKFAKVIIALGILFILNAIFGRYVVLPGYLEGLEQGAGTLDGAVQTVSAWKVIRYLLWAYSFKLGLYFTLLGAVLRTSMAASEVWLVAIVGFVYIVFAYIPLPESASIVFGVAGGMMTLVMLYIIWRWARERGKSGPSRRTASDLRMAGFFFLAMATYTLCPLLGVKTFALSPEKMIRYGLQGEASSFAFHLLIELALGWILIGLSYNQKFLERIPK